MASGQGRRFGTSEPPVEDDFNSFGLDLAPLPLPAPVESKWPRSRIKSVVGSALRWTGAFFLVIVSLMLFSMASFEKASQVEALKPGIDTIRAEKADQMEAEYGEADLPDEATGARWISQATSSGRAVAEVQNGLLGETGPISLKGIPKSDDEAEPEYACSEDVDILPGRPHAYSKQERIDCAVRRRQDALEALESRLASYLDVSSRKGRHLNVVAPWHVQVKGVDDEEGTVSLSDYEWVFPEVRVFGDDGVVPVVWQLSNAEGVPIAWVKGVFEPTTNGFEDLVLIEIDPAATKAAGASS